MAQREPDRVGGIGTEFTLQFQERHHHELNLFLQCAALPDDRQLHFARRVFVHGGDHRKYTADGRTPRLPQLQRAVGVAVHENALDGDLLRAVLPDELLDAVEDLA